VELESPRGGFPRPVGSGNPLQDTSAGQKRALFLEGTPLEILVGLLIPDGAH